MPHQDNLQLLRQRYNYQEMSKDSSTTTRGSLSSSTITTIASDDHDAQQTRPPPICRFFPMSMGWKVVVLLLRARANMRVIINNVYKTREEMKLYCRIFPSDYEFERDTLIQLWIAMEFSRQRCAEDFCKRYFYILLEGQYILKSRVDILTGKTLYKVDLNKFTTLSDGLQTTDEDRLTELADGNADGTKSWHISLVPKNIQLTTFERLKSYGNGLRTLLFIRTLHSPLKQMPSDIFLTLAFVQALDLSGICINELPRSIGNAKQLRYLDLSFTLIESLPESIENLRHLQTLKLEGCKHLYELPKGIKQLICLRHLYFDVLGQLTLLPKGIGALTELRTLSAFIVDSEEGCSIRELKNMNNLSGSTCISGLENVSYVDIHEAALHDKQHLTHLQLRWNDLKVFNTQDQDDAKCIISTLKLSKDLEELQIICYPGEELPSWVDLREHEKLVSITLLNCENNILSLNYGLLPSLKYLNIIHMNRVEELSGRFRGGHNDAYRAFPKLEKLVIDCMFSLQTWVDVKDGDFGLLSTLIIKQCPKLNKLPFLSYLYSLKHLEISHCNLLESLPEGTLSTSLETLIIDESPLLKNRCLKDGDDWHKVKHVSNLWIDLEAIRTNHEDDYEMVNLKGEASCSVHEDDNLDNKSTIAPKKRQRVPSAYNKFIKEEIQRITASNPGISHREAFSAAAKNWAHNSHIHFGPSLDGQSQGRLYQPVSGEKTNTSRGIY